MGGKVYYFIFTSFLCLSALVGKTFGFSIPVEQRNQVVAIPPVVHVENGLARQEQPSNSAAVDSIEDAILAALETAQLEESAKTTLAPINRPNLGITGAQQQIPQYPILPGLPPSFSQFGIIGANHFPSGLLLPPWSPHSPITATGSPAEYIGGIVGNLAGAAENTVKLVASSSNALLGVAGHVTCTLNPMCAIKGK